MLLLENLELLFLSFIVLAASFASLFFSIRAYRKYYSLQKTYDLFMSGRDAESLEQYFLDIQNDVDHIVDDYKKIKEILKEVRRISKTSLQKIGIQRYDAFEEKTGKRSFAFCLLDYTNTGIITTCQNTGNGTLMFIKEVNAGVTSVKLGPEEERALYIAMGQVEPEKIT